MRLIRGKSWKLSCRELNVICYSGIVRGSVAFALILTVDGSNPAEANQVQILKSTVLFMVFFTTIVMGGFMPLVIKYSLKDETKRSLEDMQPNKEIEMKMMGNDEKVLGQEEESSPQQAQTNLESDGEDKSRAAKCWSYVDEKFLKRWLIFRYEERSLSIRHLKDLIKKEAEQSRQPYLSILMASINTNSQRPDQPEMDEEKEAAPTPPRKESIEMSTLQTGPHSDS